MRHRLVAALLLVAVLLPLAAEAGAPGAAAQSAVRLMRPTDPLRGPTRGAADRAFDFARHYGAQRLAEVNRYVREVYRLAPRVGLDPGIVVAQSALETDTWRTRYWIDHLNPAAIGVTHDGAGSATWASGTDAARGQIVHLYLYAVGQIPANHLLAPYKHLDPRYQAAIDAGYGGCCRAIDDLSGRWAVDPRYGPKIAGRGNDLFVRLRFLAAARSVGSTNPWLADDAGAATAWQTRTAAPPAAAFLRFDIGTVRPLGTVRWLFAESGFADAMTIALSADGATWTTVASVGNAPALAWQALTVGRSARYVRFAFANPNRDPKLGALAEVQLWPPTDGPIP